VGMLVRLLVPVALAAVVVVSAVKAEPIQRHVKPAPSRTLQLHR
jgi:hypothetical protein